MMPYLLQTLEKVWCTGEIISGKKRKIISCVADFMYETDGKIWADLFMAVMPCDEQVT